MRYGPARKAYKNALHFRKDFPEPWNNLGTTYFMQKKYGKSAKYYQRAIQLNGQSASFHMNLGTTDYHLDRFDKAVLEYRAALLNYVGNPANPRDADTKLRGLVRLIMSSPVYQMS